MKPTRLELPVRLLGSQKAFKDLNTFSKIHLNTFPLRLKRLAHPLKENKFQSLINKMIETFVQKPTIDGRNRERLKIVMI